MLTSARVLALVGMCWLSPPLQADINELGFLIGSWTCETQLAEMRSDYRWILDKSHIEHEQTVRIFGQTHRVKEIIGWDTATQAPKGWIFAKNWTATSRYHKEGEIWKIEAVLLRQDGTESTKRKTLTAGQDEFTIVNETAPLPDLLTLEFKRQAEETKKRPNRQDAKESAKVPEPSKL